MFKITNHKKIVVICIFAVIFMSTSIRPQTGVRQEISFPDIPGYKTLKCDLHMHTVFSDGNVWPPVRIEEAWREGLDCISITDHIDYLPYRKDIPSQHNRSYELALSKARQLDILLVRGAEITYSMPPGHFNMIFIKDANPLDKEQYLEILQEADNQGAFITWNHPSYPHPEDKEEWFAEHEEIYKKGWMMGIEVANGNYYYPKAHQWALDKGLTMIGTSDSHNPMGMSYDFSKGEHRPLTLVFAKERSLYGIKEALLKRRTVVYWKNKLIGKQQYLKPIFNRSIKPLFTTVVFRNNKALLQIRNLSDIDFELASESDNGGFKATKDLTLYAHKTIRLSVTARYLLQPGLSTYKIPYRVKNLLTAPERGLEVAIAFKGYSLDHIFLNPVTREGKHLYQLTPEKNEKNIFIRYTLDGSEPNKESTSDSVPFRRKSPFTLTFRAFEKDTPLGPPVVKKGFLHKACGKKVVLKEKMSPSYPGGGTYALTDGFIGSDNYRDGSWVGFKGEDMMATLDLGKKTNLKTVRMQFLQKISSWIFLPRQVKVMVSEDGENYQQVSLTNFKDPQKYENKLIKPVTVKLRKAKIRYIRIDARSIGKCPDWHSSAGQKAWLFIDEIIVE